MATTRIKSFNIKKFRGLEDISFEVGSQLTVVCGKNGTSKSSILGIAAQIFSFRQNPLTDAKLQFKTISGEAFKSLPSEHFRFSETFDPPGSMSITIDVKDGYTNRDASPELRLYTRGDKIARPVVRNNDTVPGKQTSRNLTHPVIYLSLKRLMPIALRDIYHPEDSEYLQRHKARFSRMNNFLLGKRSANVTATGGSIKSAVAYGENYDQDSVSAGEDNAGQIVLALMSFRRLKEEYPDYQGGLLLIDEADAGLFPAAQENLISLLISECEELNIQTIITSHSPTIIENIYEKSTKFRRKFKTIYLSNSLGKIQVKEDYSWPDIYADLMIKTTQITPELSLPQPNIYFEDREGFDLFNSIFNRSKIKKFINVLDDVSMGCGNYLHLIKHKIPEFTRKSVIILDGDVPNENIPDSVILLPGGSAPDKIIFEYLYNLPEEDPLWNNKHHFHRANFDRAAAKVIEALEIEGENIALQEFVDEYYKNNGGSKETKKDGRLRTLFKDFYKDPELKKLLSIQTSTHNPWKRWIKDNEQQCEEFRQEFKRKLIKTFIEGHGVQSAQVESIKDL